MRTEIWRGVAGSEDADDDATDVRDIDSAENPFGEAVERDRARALRVVAYIRWRIPPLRDGGAPVTGKRELL